MQMLEYVRYRLGHKLARYVLAKLARPAGEIWPPIHNPTPSLVPILATGAGAFLGAHFLLHVPGWLAARVPRTWFTPGVRTQSWMFASLVAWAPGIIVDGVYTRMAFIAASMLESLRSPEHACQEGCGYQRGAHQENSHAYPTRRLFEARVRGARLWEYWWDECGLGPCKEDAEAIRDYAVSFLKGQVPDAVRHVKEELQTEEELAAAREMAGKKHGAEPDCCGEETGLRSALVDRDLLCPVVWPDAIRQPLPPDAWDPETPEHASDLQACERPSTDPDFCRRGADAPTGTDVAQLVDHGRGICGYDGADEPDACPHVRHDRRPSWRSALSCGAFQLVRVALLLVIGAATAYLGILYVMHAYSSPLVGWIARGHRVLAR